MVEIKGGAVGGRGRFRSGWHHRWRLLDDLRVLGRVEHGHRGRRHARRATGGRLSGGGGRRRVDVVVGAKLGGASSAQHAYGGTTGHAAQRQVAVASPDHTQQVQLHNWKFHGLIQRTS